MMVKIYIDKSTKKVICTSIIPLYTTSYGNNGYYAIPIYKAFNNEELYQSLSNKDIKRMEEGIEIITQSALGVKLGIDELQTEYYYYKDGYKRKEVDKLDLTEAEKNSEIYQKIASSNKTCYIGDSIAEGTKNGGYGWYEPLANTIENTSSIKIAKGGYTSQDILDNFVEQIENSDCELTVLAIGTNDIRYNRLDVKNYVKNIKDIIELTNKNVIIISPWKPLISDFKNLTEYYEVMKIYDQYAEKLKNFSDEHNYLFVNPNNYIDSVLKYESETDYLLDTIHPNSNKGIKLYSQSILH